MKEGNDDIVKSNIDLGSFSVLDYVFSMYGLWGFDKLPKFLSPQCRYLQNGIKNYLPHPICINFKSVDINKVLRKKTALTHSKHC